MRLGRAWSAIGASALILGLAGCGGKAPEVPDPLDSQAVAAAVARGEGIDPAGYAGSFAMKAPLEVPLDEAKLPFMLYAGLNQGGETRLNLQGVVDLRQIQAQLPELLTGVVVDNCKHQFALDFAAADAQADSLRAWGTVNAQFFRCRGEEDDLAARGGRFLSARIEAFAVASVKMVDQCIGIELRDVQLDPRGFLGGVANLFGLTAIARSVILEKAGEILAENPVCPELPPELASLAPRYDSVGPRELGAGGIGAELSGSVDTSAQTLISLIAVMQDKGLLEERQ